MKRDDRRFWYAVGVAALIAAAYFMDKLDNMTTDTVAQAFVLAIRNVIHISLIIGWCVSLRQRIINAQVRRSLAAVSILMAFWTLYCFGIFRRSDLTVVDCLIIALLLESAVQSGLIPSNTNYHEMFRASTVAAQIVDVDYQPCFISASAVPFTQDEMKQAGEQPVKVGHTILHAKPVKAGHVLWQDDVTELDEIMARLQETQRQLGRKNELLQAELKLKEQQTQTEEKTRLYDRITQEVAPQIKKMEALLAQAADPMQARGSMAKICVIGSYVKRRGNLLLLGEENRRVHAREIEYCIRESLDNLQLAGETVMIPYEEPDGTYVHVSLELFGDGTGYFETTNEYSDITWACDEKYIVRVTLEDGRNYYASVYTMGGEGHVWLLLELEECMVWLY